MPVPAINGRRLTNLSITHNLFASRGSSVRLDFAERKSKVVVDRSGRRSVYGSTSDGSVQFDSVEEVELMDWFHPQFPLPVV